MGIGENWKKRFGELDGRARINWVIVTYLQSFGCREHLMDVADAREIYSKLLALIGFGGDSTPATALARSPRWWRFRRCKQNRLIASEKAHRCREVQRLPCFVPACRLRGRERGEKHSVGEKLPEAHFSVHQTVHNYRWTSRRSMARLMRESLYEREWSHRRQKV